MIQSMTGFGSSENNDFAVEIRSLNHRFIDISIKMPPYLSQHEIPLRNIIKEKFNRGRFDISISASHGKLTQLRINKAIAKNIYTALQGLQQEFSIPGQISMDTLSVYKEFLIEEETVYDADALFQAFHEAVSRLETMRIREGALLVEEIRNRVGSLTEMSARIKSRAPDEVARWREKFTERLQAILEAGMIDNNRIVQEAAIMAEKLDISEEINRTEYHLKQFTEILSGEITVGKKLDFLLQELGREVNTLAYKSGDYSISSIVVDMKAELEKMREQVQNIQ